MKTEIFVTCDYAADYGGKLCISGTFDTIYSAAVPVIHPHCSIAAKMRFVRAEQGKKLVTLSILDAANNPIAANLEIPIEVKLGQGATTIPIHIIATIGGLKFNTHGDYQVVLILDGTEIGRIPVYLRPPQMQ